MGDNEERLDAVLRRRHELLPVVDEQIDRWRRILQLTTELGDAVAGTQAVDPGGDIAERLGALDLAGMARAARDSLDALATVRGRVNRGTVNIGVSGRARNGKSTLLQSLSGLDDQQIPSGRGQPVTAVRSRIYHSRTERGARLTMHTERSFLDEVIAPYHAELGLGPAPRDLSAFSRHSYPGVADGPDGRDADQPRLGPMLARVREAQQALASYREFLTGGTRTEDLAGIRQWVAYPEADAEPDRRPYLAVRDAQITCAFPIEDVTALGLVDLPGLGELTPGAEAHHLAGLRNDIDFAITVKRPTDTNAMWAEEDARALQLIGSACEVADPRDFALILVNTGECLAENIEALHSDLRNRLNDPAQGRGYWVILADGADRDAVREQILKPVLEHLASVLPRMDEAVIADTVAVCRDRLDRITAELDRVSSAVRALSVPTSTEQTIARAESLRAEVAASLQEWVDELRTRADNEYEDTEFYERVAEVHQAVRDWVLSGFGEGAEEWQQRALNRFRVDRASLPFASAELNRIRVEMARRFAAVDDLLLQRRNEYWAGLVAALGPRFAALIDGRDTGPQEAITALAAVLRDAPDPCPALAETFGFALDVRLDYRTRVLPRLRRALDVLFPEDDDPGSGSTATTLLAVPRTAEGSAELYGRVTQLARQAAYDAQAVLAQEPRTTAQVLFAYGEQFEDAFVRSDSSEAEFRRLVAAFHDLLWPGEGTGPHAAAEGLRRVRRLTTELRGSIADERSRTVGERKGR
ncbi:hypothetical protein [Streptomyces albipurpureus]|uniref:Dynamin family protein n=1 Tax=Streptomyces albipurpureus TaxID=2897419 RepID=A0ABT0UK67_9ACTN|nr:hypothetical protein [Streptomyces sp. CWNU-1]MCM2387671.1 hypothetical protein [Streptomyces sp. CWNU-1]